VIFPREEDFAPVHNRVAVGKSIDMTVEYNALPDKFRVLEIITPFHIVAYVVPDDYFLRITGQVDMCKYIHEAT
jgi:hypothetical protein